jgi:predicted SprT family Zn-dependent metalloprotease
MIRSSKADISLTFTTQYFTPDVVFMSRMKITGYRMITDTGAYRYIL